MNENYFTNFRFIVDKYGHKIEIYIFSPKEKKYIFFSLKREKMYEHNFYEDCVYRPWIDFDEYFHWNKSQSDDDENMFDKMRDDYMKNNRAVFMALIKGIEFW